MRKLAIGAALSGALALAGLAAPAASAAPSTPDLKFTGIKVNNGKAIVVGTTKSVSVPVTYTLTRPVDVNVDGDSSFAGVILYRGTLKSVGNIVGPDDLPTCTTTATTDTTVTATCSEKIVFYPEDGLLSAADATTWKAGGFYSYIDGTVSDDFLSSSSGTAIWGNLGTAQLQRAAKLTADASPEPVAKGKTITVKGKLTRADWDAAAYKGYQGEPGKPGRIGCFTFGDLPDKPKSDLTGTDKIRIMLTVESGQAKKADVIKKYKISEKEFDTWDKQFRDGDWAALMALNSLFGS
ncbi:DUF1153 domain-containing protein [Streptomyces sp. NPDC004270]